MIHKFYLNGFYIITDVNSGAVFSVDPCAYEVVDYVQTPMTQECPANIIEAVGELYEVKDILEAYDELYSLFCSDSLFSESNYETFADKLGPAPIKSMCLNIAHDCNMRCGYCFASQGNFGQDKSLMSAQTGIAAIDFLLKHSGKRRNLEVDFFGGEPLMNIKVVKEIVSYARSKEKAHNKCFRFTITTNGLLLNDDIIDFINREMSNVVLSIDGRKEVNDALRTRADGSGTYDSILPKFNKLVSGRNKKDRQDYYVRGTYTKYNLDFIEDVMDLANNGFDQISIEPAITDGTMDYSLTESDLPTIFKEYEKLARITIAIKKRGISFNFFHFMLDLEQGPCVFKRLRGCSCGNEYVAVTPKGDIYPCHQFVGNDDWIMGNVLKGTLNREIKESFSKATVFEKETCKDCWAKFYCSGGCNANNYTYNGSILSPHHFSCEIEKKRLECAIMMNVALAK